MGKLTDRILWTVLVLAVGISMFVFGKPAFVNLTNQVLHRDDLKATMQSPSLTSLHLWTISAVNNDVGVSKHAYIVGSTSDISNDSIWNYDNHKISFPKEIRQTPIPYNSYVKVIFKIKVDKPVRLILDASNHLSTGHRSRLNDKDNVDNRIFLLDNNSTGIDLNLSAGTWHTIEYEYENTASTNTQHVALFDDSTIDFDNNSSNNVNVQVKDFVFAVDNVKYR